MDARLRPATARVAHVSLRGQVDGVAFTAGEKMLVGGVSAAMLANEAGTENLRQLNFGEAFTELERAGRRSFGFAGRDGYCGWVESEALIHADGRAPTHRVAAIRSLVLSTPDLRCPDEPLPLSFGARVRVHGQIGDWAEIDSYGPRDLELDIKPGAMFIPARHLAPLDTREADPVAVAERFLGTPYLWGGNSAFGIDCSGLVQTALLACGITCPGDSDQQQALGAEATGASQRGDLYFWKGHVAMARDGETLIHANAHAMAVALEPLEAALARIEAAGTLLLMRRRL